MIFSRRGRFREGSEVYIAAASNESLSYGFPFYLENEDKMDAKHKSIL